MPGEPTVIYSAANSQQAHLLKGLLEERGIPAWVVNDAIGLAGGELPLGWTAAARVVVSQSDAEEARQFALNFDRRTAHEPEPDLPAGEPPSQEWSDWPSCRECGERRAARCPICGTSGTQFALADIQELESGPRVLLLCENCDDHFLPEWYRLCPRCGFDYGDGIEIGRTSALPAMTARAWIVLGWMIAGAAVFLAYFVWLFWK